MDEALRLSAPLARSLATRLCRADASSGKSCEWLHGFWQCLRLLELAADPGRHAAFYDEALGAARGANGRLRVLISGAADQSMLAHVAAAIRGGAELQEVCVIDRCDTPLELNCWFAERIGVPIETQRCSVLDYRPSVPFDVICTHSFFGQFAKHERPRLLECWHDMLRAGGRVVTAHPLRTSGADEPNQFSPEQAQMFRTAVAARAEELGALLGTGAQDVLERAESYLGVRYGYPVRSLQELRELFERGGFAVEHLEQAAIPAGPQQEAGGPGLRNARVRYAHVIATRRA